MAYTIDVRIEGTRPLLHHRYLLPTPDQLDPAPRRKTGGEEFAYEWLRTMHTRGGLLVQPATHVEGALIHTAGNYRIRGARNKTYRDAFRSYITVHPEHIPLHRDGHPLPAPGPELLRAPTEHLCVNIQRAVIKGARGASVARARLQINAGWTLTFAIHVDDDIPITAVETILNDAGRAAALGDYRPRYGRFRVIQFAQRDAATAASPA